MGKTRRERNVVQGSRKGRMGRFTQDLLTVMGGGGASPQHPRPACRAAENAAQGPYHSADHLRRPSDRAGSAAEGTAKAAGSCQH